MTLLQYPQENSNRELAQKILALEDTAWPGSRDEIFPSSPETYVTSFVMLEAGRAVCHVGIRRSTLLHRERMYLAYGLSEVVTHPDYRGRGIASGLIKRAAVFIAEEHPDISVFTCEKARVPFYTKGGWEAIEGACFVGGTGKKPFRSDSLGLVTMMMFISPKGKARRADFENGDIVLELGENQLW